MSSACYVKYGLIVVVLLLTLLLYTELLYICELRLRFEVYFVCGWWAVFQVRSSSRIYVQFFYVSLINSQNSLNVIRLGRSTFPYGQVMLHF